MDLIKYKESMVLNNSETLFYDNYERLSKSLVDSCFHYMRDLKPIFGTTGDALPVDYSIVEYKTGLIVTLHDYQIFVDYKPIEGVTVMDISLLFDGNSSERISPLTIMRSYDYASLPLSWKKHAQFRYHAIINMSHQWLQRQHRIRTINHLQNIINHEEREHGRCIY